MARPRLQNIEYFPHDCKLSEELSIVDQRYGNDGYTLWYKLREMLGQEPGHYLDTHVPKTWETLKSKTRLTAEKCTEILDLMAELWVLDRELWQKNRVIWVQEFADDLSEIYRKRKAKPPVKPSFRAGNPLCDGVSGAETAGNPTKESRVEKNKKETHENPACEELRIKETINPHRASEVEQKPSPPDPSGVVTEKAMSCIGEHNFSEFKKIYPQPEGIFPDEEECRNEFDGDRANWNQILRGAENFAMTDQARRGIGIYKPITFLRKRLWRNYQQQPKPLGAGVGESAARDELRDALTNTSFRSPPHGMTEEAWELFRQRGVPWPVLQQQVNSGEVEI